MDHAQQRFNFRHCLIQLDMFCSRLPLDDICGYLLPVSLQSSFAPSLLLVSQRKLIFPCLLQCGDCTKDGKAERMHKTSNSVQNSIVCSKNYTLGTSASIRVFGKVEMSEFTKPFF